MRIGGSHRHALRFGGGSRPILKDVLLHLRTRVHIVDGDALRDLVAFLVLDVHGVALGIQFVQIDGTAGILVVREAPTYRGVDPHRLGGVAGVSDLDGVVGERPVVPHRLVEVAEREVAALQNEALVAALVDRGDRDRVILTLLVEGERYARAVGRGAGLRHRVQTVDEVPVALFVQIPALDDVPVDARRQVRVFDGDPLPDRDLVPEPDFRPDRIVSIADGVARLVHRRHAIAVFVHQEQEVAVFARFLHEIAVFVRIEQEVPVGILGLHGPAVFVGQEQEVAVGICIEPESAVFVGQEIAVFVGLEEKVAVGVRRLHRIALCILLVQEVALSIFLVQDVAVGVPQDLRARLILGEAPTEGRDDRLFRVEVVGDADGVEVDERIFVPLGSGEVAERDAGRGQLRAVAVEVLRRDRDRVAPTALDAGERMVVTFGSGRLHRIGVVCLFVAFDPAADHIILDARTLVRVGDGDALLDLVAFGVGLVDGIAVRVPDVKEDLLPDDRRIQSIAPSEGRVDLFGVGINRVDTGDDGDGFVLPLGRGEVADQLAGSDDRTPVVEVIRRDHIVNDVRVVTHVVDYVRVVERSLGTGVELIAADAGALIDIVGHGGRPFGKLVAVPVDEFAVLVLEVNFTDRPVGVGAAGVDVMGLGPVEGALGQRIVALGGIVVDHDGGFHIAVLPGRSGDVARKRRFGGGVIALQPHVVHRAQPVVVGAGFDVDDREEAEDLLGVEIILVDDRGHHVFLIVPRRDRGKLVLELVLSDAGAVLAVVRPIPTDGQHRPRRFGVARIEGHPRAHAVAAKFRRVGVAVQRRERLAVGVIGLVALDVHRADPPVDAAAGGDAGHEQLRGGRTLEEHFRSRVGGIIQILYDIAFLEPLRALEIFDLIVIDLVGSDGVVPEQFRPAGGDGAARIVGVHEIRLIFRHGEIHDHGGEIETAVGDLPSAVGFVDAPRKRLQIGFVDTEVDHARGDVFEFDGHFFAAVDAVDQTVGGGRPRQRRLVGTGNDQRRQFLGGVDHFVRPAAGFADAPGEFRHVGGDGSEVDLALGGVAFQRDGDFRAVVDAIDQQVGGVLPRQRRPVGAGDELQFVDVGGGVGGPAVAVVDAPRERLDLGGADIEVEHVTGGIVQIDGDFIAAVDRVDQQIGGGIPRELHLVGYEIAAQLFGSGGGELRPAFGVADAPLQRLHVGGADLGEVDHIFLLAVQRDGDFLAVIDVIDQFVGAGDIPPQRRLTGIEVGIQRLDGLVAVLRPGADDLTVLGESADPPLERRAAVDAGKDRRGVRGTGRDAFAAADDVLDLVALVIFFGLRPRQHRFARRGIEHGALIPVEVGERQRRRGVLDFDAHHLVFIAQSGSHAADIDRGAAGGAVDRKRLRDDRALIVERNVAGAVEPQIFAAIRRNGTVLKQFVGAVLRTVQIDGDGRSTEQRAIVFIGGNDGGVLRRSVQVEADVQQTARRQQLSLHRGVGVDDERVFARSEFDSARDLGGARQFDMVVVGGRETAVERSLAVSEDRIAFQRLKVYHICNIHPGRGNISGDAEIQLVRRKDADRADGDRTRHVEGVAGNGCDLTDQDTDILNDIQHQLLFSGGLRRGRINGDAAGKGVGEQTGRVDAVNLGPRGKISVAVYADGYIGADPPRDHQRGVGIDAGDGGGTALYRRGIRRKIVLEVGAAERDADRAAEVVLKDHVIGGDALDLGIQISAVADCGSADGASELAAGDERRPAVDADRPERVILIDDDMLADVGGDGSAADGIRQAVAVGGDVHDSAEFAHRQRTGVDADRTEGVVGHNATDIELRGHRERAAAGEGDAEFVVVGDGADGGVDIRPDGAVTCQIRTGAAHQTGRHEFRHGRAAVAEQHVPVSRSSGEQYRIRRSRRLHPSVGRRFARGDRGGTDARRGEIVADDGYTGVLGIEAARDDLRPRIRIGYR